MFVIAVNLNIVVRYKHEISLIKNAKPHQEADIEFEFDCIIISLLTWC